MSSCSWRSRTVEVLYDAQPWMEVTVTATEIDPKHERMVKDDICLAMISPDGSDVALDELSAILEREHIGITKRFPSEKGVARGRLSYGTWVIYMNADTRGKGGVTVITIDQSTRMPVKVDFRHPGKD